MPDSFPLQVLIPAQVNPEMPGVYAGSYKSLKKLSRHERGLKGDIPKGDTPVPGVTVSFLLKREGSSSSQIYNHP